MEWQRIGRASFRQRLALVVTGAGAVVALLLAQFVIAPIAGLLVDAGALAADGAGAGGSEFDVQEFVVSLGVGLVSTAAAAGVAVVAALLHPGLEASPDGARLRIGRHRLPASALHRAWLGFETQAGDRQQLILRLEAGKRRTRLWLRAQERVLLTDDERALLVRVLEQSSIEPPRSPYDPGGRFARVNFPGSLTKQEAIDLVRDVPAPGARLPVTD